MTEATQSKTDELGFRRRSVRAAKQRWIACKGYLGLNIAVGGLVIACALLAMTVARGASLDAAKLLKDADSVKSSNYAEFTSLVQRLEAVASDLSPGQQVYLRYLQGWQVAYKGDYESAIPLLNAAITDSLDPNMQFRARATLVNVLSIARHYEEAFSQLTYLLQALPTVQDNEARGQGLRVAALLFNQVGENELALGYAEKLSENLTGRDECTSAELKLRISVTRIANGASIGPEYESGVVTCTKAGELVFANLIRTYIAQIYMQQGRLEDAIRLLIDHHEEATKTKYPPLLSEYDALLAQLYRESGNTALARQYATRAIEDSIRNEYTKPLVAAYRLLYLLAKEQGDANGALAFHEKYTAADKGYLNDTGARQLAYQRVKHEVDANKLQIEALNKQNEVLKLQRQLSDKALENIRLYIILSTVVVSFILLWAYRTKLSQLHFMKLSRQDGLTGIFNRPHFIDLSSRALASAKKSGQSLCIAICDLDHFKAINDNWGHATGDAVLKQAAVRFTSLLQRSDLVGRLGGEEFGILLVDCDLTLARQRCEQLRLALAEISIDSQTSQSKLSASFGIAGTASSGHEFRQLLAHADSALYRAKRSGRNCVVLHDDDASATPSMTEVDERRLSA